MWATQLVPERYGALLKAGVRSCSSAWLSGEALRVAAHPGATGGLLGQQVRLGRSARQRREQNSG